MVNEAEFKEQTKAARRRGQERATSPTRAVAVRYNPEADRIEIELAHGGMFAVPPALIEGLEGASPEELKGVRLVGPGIGLRWDKSDVDVSVEGLLVGVFGSRPWMRELARRGGQSRSEAKARAARDNGRRGGRPRQGKRDEDAA